MAKAKAGKGLSTTGKVLIGVGVLLLGFGTYWYLTKRKIAKMKKECEDNGGIWDEKTKTCTLPENKTTKVLKDAYDNLTFESGKAIIKPTSFPYLDELVSVIQDPDALTWTLEIQGHTDNVGGADYNQKLSENRANAVKKYLVDKGVKADRITAKGFGLSKPIATNDTPEGRSKNRRVEFLISKPKLEEKPTEQAKKQWISKQKEELRTVDESRLEQFTKIPNYEKGTIAFRSREDFKGLGYKNVEIFPEGGYLRWSLNSDWEANKSFLTSYVEDGKIVKLNKDTKTFELLGTWK